MGDIYKNTSGQKVAVYAWNKATGNPQTGDASNITGQISIDGAASASTNDTNPTELDSTNHAGVYIFDLSQAESNGDIIVLTPSSSTPNVTFTPANLILFTEDYSFLTLGQFLGLKG